MYIMSLAKLVDNENDESKIVLDDDKLVDDVQQEDEPEDEDDVEEEEEEEDEEDMIDDYESDEADNEISDVDDNIRIVNKSLEEKDNTQVVLENLKEKVFNIDLENDDNYEEYDDCDELLTDDEDDKYLEKFEEEVKHDFIKDFHPESTSHNDLEVKKFAKISRDKRGMIVDDFHKTIPFLTKYEHTRVIGQRAKQIDSGALPFVEVDNEVIDGYTIAVMELEQKKLPFILKRPLPGGGCEYWKLEDLELLR